MIREEDKPVAFLTFYKIVIHPKLTPTNCYPESLFQKRIIYC